jgi:hypothetical protein
METVGAALLLSFAAMALAVADARARGGEPSSGAIRGWTSGPLTVLAATLLPALASVVTFSLLGGDGVAGVARAVVALALGAAAPISAPALAGEARDGSDTAAPALVRRTLVTSAAGVAMIGGAAHALVPLAAMTLGAAAGAAALRARDVRSDAESDAESGVTERTAGDDAAASALRLASACLLFTQARGALPAATGAIEACAALPVWLEASGLFAAAITLRALGPLGATRRVTGYALQWLALVTSAHWLTDVPLSLVALLGLLGALAGEAARLALANEREGAASAALLAGMASILAAGALGGVVVAAGVGAPFGLASATALAFGAASLVDATPARSTRIHWLAALGLAAFVSSHATSATTQDARLVARASAAAVVALLGWSAVLLTWSLGRDAPPDGSRELRWGPAALGALLWAPLASLALDGLGLPRAAPMIATTTALAMVLATSVLALRAIRERLARRPRGGVFGVAPSEASIGHTASALELLDVASVLFALGLAALLLASRLPTSPTAH